jgi:hypothetical protein
MHNNNNNNGHCLPTQLLAKTHSARARARMLPRAT